jgi:phosphoribosyl 1,2-cyclic phosphodiesterase
MRVKYWGARGSIPTPGPEKSLHGGNTSCVEVTLSDGTELILDAGTGICELGRDREHAKSPIHLLLTHLHLDHIQGLMFFEPLFDPRCEVHVNGPTSSSGSLLKRLARYISAPLSPIEIRELPAKVEFEDIKTTTWTVGPATVEAGFVNHRGPTLGYRIIDSGTTLAYIPDHEPALGQDVARSRPEWISGFDLAHDADLLIHDCQYTQVEYDGRVGWGHSAVADTMAFARQSGARRLALFHHDPLHDDAAVAAILEDARSQAGGSLEVTAAREGHTVELD